MPNQILKNEEKGKGEETIFEIQWPIIFWNLFKKKKTTNNSMFKIQYISSKTNKNKSTSRHITIKLQKIKDKAKF